jgi:hypothetical protein
MQRFPACSDFKMYFGSLQVYRTRFYSCDALDKKWTDYCNQNIHVSFRQCLYIRVIKLRTVRLAGHIARLKEYVPHFSRET